jgi:hypothetical protein
MKKIAFILFLITHCLNFGQTKYLSEGYQFKKGDTIYLFGDKVKLREKPSTDSSVITLLKIGEIVEIVEKTNSFLMYEGLKSPWYKVKYNDTFGYVLGGLMSLDTETYKNYTYLIAFKKKNDALFLKTRIIGNNQDDYFENVSKLHTHEFSIKASDDKGVEHVKSIFLIDYLAEACGVNGGGIYLFYTGDNLLKAIEYSQIGDADLYWFIEEYTFPADDNGKKGRILYKREVGEQKDEVTEWVEIKITHRNLEWIDNEITPKIEFDN